jgi:FixJ family two-component response regulator
MTQTTRGEADRPRVFVVDDDEQIVKALSRLLRTHGFAVDTYTSARAFLEAHDARVPGCAILDLGMEEFDGLAVQDVLRSGDAPRPVVFLTGSDDVSSSVKAMKAGAIDYLTKPVEGDALIRAVEVALDFDQSARVERQILDDYRSRLSLLTPREREVMNLVVMGRLNKQIAHELGTVEKTIKVHRAHIMTKMEVRSVAALVHIVDRLRAVDERPAR